MIKRQPLRRVAAPVGSGTQGAQHASPTLQALLRWQPLEDRRWFAQASFYRYVHGDRQRPWNPDVAYQFGFDEPKPGGWTAMYSNYSGTRLRPLQGRDAQRLNVPQGQWTLGRKFTLPEGLEPLLLVGDGDSAMCQAAGHWVPRYTTPAGAGLEHDKLSASLSCRYQRPEGWFAHFTAFAWPQRSQQQPWDPDYTYGFGWAGPDGLAVQYNNYSGNRWPGRSLARGEGRPSSGSVSLSWTTSW